jgi:hypothetical protein
MRRVLAPVLVLLVLAAVPAARADPLVFVEGSGAGVFGDLARTGVSQYRTPHPDWDH